MYIGSHNSGSYSVSTDFGVGQFTPVPAWLSFFFVRWSKCHEKDVYSQLMKGSRYIDLRVCRSHLDGELRTEHTVYGEKLSILLGQICRFLIDYPSEIVILFCHKFRSGFDHVEDHDSFLKLLVETFPDHDTSFVRRNEFSAPYSELISRNRRIMVIYGDERVVKNSSLSLHSPLECQIDHWFNKSNVQELEQSIESYRPWMDGEGRKVKMPAAATLTLTALDYISSFPSLLSISSLSSRILYHPASSLFSLL